MALNSAASYPEWLHYFDSIDSTNICAGTRIDAGLAHHGDVIWALHQTKGRGQRGKIWEDEPGANIAMSLIVKPDLPVNRYPLLSMATAVTIAQYFSILYENWNTAIKWPNDIYINDKKTSGILIENIWKGMDWQYAVIGIGINVNQRLFTENLPNATSLRIESGKKYDLQETITDIRNGLLNTFRNLLQHEDSIQKDYNKMLFMKHKEVRFEQIKTGKKFYAFVQEVNPEGQLVLLTTTGIEKYTFGELVWHL